MDKIGKYQILSKIGKGGMGVVYRAKDPYLAREVAVKVMSEDLCAEPNFQERFMREARVSVGLKHENVIDVYDMSEDHGLLYLAMEYLEGHDLKSELAAQKRMPLERKLQIMLGVCRGLGYAHQRGIVHRDIKPANIFITKSGPPKILDFGLARLASAELTHARSFVTSDLSKQGDVMGTPAYMSPEQVRSDKVDERSDIYSCGVVFYELISGKKAFVADSLTALMFKITTNDAIPLETVDPQIPTELSALIGRFMAKKPADRYPNMGEALKDLEAFVASLEERKARLQTAVSGGLEKLEKLLLDNKDLFQPGAPELVNLGQIAPPLMRVVDGTYDVNQSVTTWRPPQNYYYLQELTERAKYEYELLSNLVRKRRQAGHRLGEAIGMIKAGRVEEALQLLQALLRDDPGDFRASAMQKEAMARIERQKQTQQKARWTDEMYQKARDALQSGELQGSMAIIQNILQAWPNHPGAISLKDAVQQRLKDRSESEKKRQLASEALGRARTAAAARDIPTARAELDAARGLFPELPGITELLESIEKSQEETGRRREQQKRNLALLDEARGFADQGEPEAAMGRLMEVLACDPQNMSARNLKQKLERHLRAEELFHKATTVLSANDPASCLALLREALNLHPEYPAAKNLLEAVQQRAAEQKALEEKRRQSLDAISAARKALASGNLQSARQEVDKARKLYPDAGDISETLKAIEHAEEQDLKVRKLLDNASMLNAAGEDDLALAQIREALLLEPSHMTAILMKRKIELQHAARDRAEKEKQARVLMLFSRAEQAESKGETADAGDLAREVLAEDGEHSGALALLERIEAALGKDKESGIRKRDRIERLLQAARGAKEAQRLPQAIQALDEIARLDRANPEAADLRRRVLETLEAEKTAQARRAEGDREKRFGLELLKNKKFSESLAALQRALEFLGDDPEVLSAIAEAQCTLLPDKHRLQIRQGMEEAERFLAIEDFDGARNQVRTILEIMPQDLRASALLKRINEAEDQKRKREQIDSHLTQAELCLAKHDYDNVVSHVRQVLWLDPGHEKARRLIAQAGSAREDSIRRERMTALLKQSNQALDQQNFDEASIRITELSLLNPQNPGVQELRERINRAREESNRKNTIASILGQCEQALNRADLEEADLRAHDVLALDPTNQQAKDFKKRIASARQQRKEKGELDTLLQKCRNALRGGQFDEAADYARQILRLNPGNSEAASLLEQIKKAGRLAEKARPHGSKEGSSKKNLARMALIAGPIALALAVAAYFGIPLFMGNPIGEILIKVEINPATGSEVAIILDGSFIDMTTRKELLLSNIRAGQHTVSARKNGYEDQTESILIEKGQNPAKALRLTGTSDPSGQELEVGTGAPDSLVILDDIYYERADKDGFGYFLKVKPGKHCIRYKAGGNLHSRSMIQTTASGAVDFSKPEGVNEGPCAN